MKFYSAQVADIQSTQRDETFIDELQDYLISIVKSFGQRNYNSIRKFLPHLTTTWYYLLTSVSNLQTLGEEYTGTIRLNRDNKIPSKYWQIAWLIFYVRGESLLERIIDYWEDQAIKSTELRNEAKKQILKGLKFFKANKDLFLRLHHSVFYINGKYYNISNRITGFKYVLVREWLQNETAARTFKLIGIISLFYIIFNLIRNFLSKDVANEIISYSSDGSKMCVLCVENRKNTCSTLCGHLFCWNCIYDSLKYQQNCPVCREIINPSRIIFLQKFAHIIF